MNQLISEDKVELGDNEKGLRFDVTGGDYRIGKIPNFFSRGPWSRDLHLRPVLAAVSFTSDSTIGTQQLMII